MRPTKPKSKQICSHPEMLVWNEGIMLAKCESLFLRRNGNRVHGQNFVSLVKRESFFTVSNTIWLLPSTLLSGFAQTSLTSEEEEVVEPVLDWTIQQGERNEPVALTTLGNKDKIVNSLLWTCFFTVHIWSCSVPPNLQKSGLNSANWICSHAVSPLEDSCLFGVNPWSYVNTLKFNDLKFIPHLNKTKSPRVILINEFGAWMVRDDLLLKELVFLFRLLAQFHSTQLY